MSDPVNPSEENAEDGNEVRYAGQHLVGIERQGALSQIVAVSELVEVDRGEQHDRGAANFRLAVDVRQVGSGIVLNALAGLVQQLVAVAKLGGAGGTDLRASGGLAGSNAGRAH